MIKLKNFFSVFVLMFIIAGTTSASADKLSVYKSGAEGVKGLNDIAMAFYKKNMCFPTLQQLLNAPIDDQTHIPLKDSGYLDKHYLAEVHANPDIPGTCKGIKIQANIGTDKTQPYLIYTLITFNIKGVWKTVCSYNEQGPNANSTSISLANCYNSSIASQMSQFNAQIKPIKAACSIN